MRRARFVCTVGRSSSARSKPRRAPLPGLPSSSILTAGGLANRPCRRSEARLRAVRAPLAAAASTWPLVLANSTNAPSLARVANAARIAVSTVGPYCRHGLALVEACAIRARALPLPLVHELSSSESPLSPVRRVRYDTDDRPATGPSGRARGSAGSSAASRPRRSSSSSSCSIRRINVSSIEEAI
jgi:hypothetical protein